MFPLKICPNPLLVPIYFFRLTPEFLHYSYFEMLGRQATDTPRRGFRYQQDNFFLGDTKCQRDAVGMGDTHGMKPFKFSAERMQSKGRQKGIGFETSQNLGEWLFEFRVGSRNLDDTPINVCAVTRRTRPAFTSFNDRRIREMNDRR